MITDAILSINQKYRYWLYRDWSGGPPVTFIMLNPSTADATVDDPTIRRCIGFARSWGWGALQVVNLFAVRATNPKELYRTHDPVGPNNRAHVQMAMERRIEDPSINPPVICAWGAHGKYMGQDQTMMRWLREDGVIPMCLHKDGTPPKPNHPLYLPGSLNPRGLA